LEHAPVPVSHVPARWQVSLGVQMTGFDPVHEPDWQASVCVHALPSAHGVPFGAFGFEHTPVPVLQTPAT
jgi:hypothetical protein